MAIQEMIMQRTNFLRTFTMATVAGIALMVAPAANADNKGCSNASLKGTFAFTGTGIVVAPPQLAGTSAEVGTQSFDGSGGTTYAATLSANGNIIPVTAKGTYTVNSDCTGTMTVVVAPFGATIHLFFAIADSGAEFHAMETEMGFIITRIGRKQFPTGDWRE